MILIPKYEKYQVVDPAKTVERCFACINCNNVESDKTELGFEICNISNTYDTDNELDINDSLDKLYIFAVCNSCSNMNVFVYEQRAGYTEFVLCEVWLEVAGKEDD